MHVCVCVCASMIVDMLLCRRYLPQSSFLNLRHLLHDEAFYGRKVIHAIMDHSQQVAILPHQTLCTYVIM